MSIAVIIVNYGSGDLVLSHLGALRDEMRQVPGAHAFIVDNASPNGDAKLLSDACAGMNDVTVVAASKNGGFSYGNNRGFESAQAAGEFDYYYLLNPDAYPRPGALKTLIQFAEDHPTVGVMGTRLEGEDGEVQASAFRYPSASSELYRTASTGVVTKLVGDKAVAGEMQAVAHQTDWVSGASLFVRTHIVDRVGPMDEGYFLYFEETDYQRSISKAGFSVWYVPAAVAVHLVGQTTDLEGQWGEKGRGPDYWYDSRRRYFTKNHGTAYALGVDVSFSLGKLINGLKRIAKRQSLKPVYADMAGALGAWFRRLKP